MFPRWISWMLLVVMGYVVFSASQVSAPVQTTKPVVVPITAEEYPALAEATDLERWKRKLNPDYAATMHCSLDAPARKRSLGLQIIESREGAGAPAACGDAIKIHLVVWGADGAEAFAGDVRLALGSRQLAAGLDVGLLGMKPGSVRTLVLPPVALVRAATGEDGKKAAREALPTDSLTVVTVTRLE